MEKTAEMTFEEALSAMDVRQEKLATAFGDLKVDELEELLKKEAAPKKEKKSDMTKLSAEQKILMADDWGRELAHEMSKLAEDPTYVGSAGRGALLHGAIHGVTGAVGGAAIGKHMGHGVKGALIGGASGAAVGAGRGALEGLSQRFIHGKNSKEKKSFVLPPGVAGMLKQAAPSLTKIAIFGAGGVGGAAAAGISGLRSAVVKGVNRGHTALALSSAKQRAGIGAGIGAVAGGLKSPGVDPNTGQKKSRLMGALGGAALGAGAGVAAPHAISAGQKMMRGAAAAPGAISAVK